MLKADEAYSSRNHLSILSTLASLSSNGGELRAGGGFVRSKQPHGANKRPFASLLRPSSLATWSAPPTCSSGPPAVAPTPPLSNVAPGASCPISPRAPDPGPCTCTVFGTILGTSPPWTVFSGPRTDGSFISGKMALSSLRAGWLQPLPSSCLANLGTFSWTPLSPPVCPGIATVS